MNLIVNCLKLSSYEIEWKGQNKYRIFVNSIFSDNQGEIPCTQLDKEVLIRNHFKREKLSRILRKVNIKMEVENSKFEIKVSMK